MSDTKTYTEREVIAREREAFVQGAGAVFHFYGVDPYSKEGWKGSYYIAKDRYPLPKGTRPRVVDSEHTPLKYRIVAGVIETALKGTDCWCRSGWNDSPVNPTSDMREGDASELAAIAKVLANPTEEVDA